MQKAAVFGHKNIKDAVLAYLQKNEILEIVLSPIAEKKSDGEISHELELAQLKASIDFLEAASGKKKSLIESFAPVKEIVNEEFLFQTVREFNWMEIVKAVDNIETELANLKNWENRLRAEMENLIPWQGLKVRLNQLTCTAKICAAAGACKTKDLEELKKKLERFSSALETKVVRSTREKTYLLIFHLLAEEKLLSDLLSKSNFEGAHLPVSERTPAEEISRLKKLLLQAEEGRKNHLDKIQTLLKHKLKLTYTYDYLFQKELENKALEKLLNTESAFMLTGWIPKKNFEKLKTNLLRVTPLCEVLAILPEKDEVPPTLIENPKIFYPFEFITRIFGLPTQAEMDPTAPLSFFYLLFFAMCLSDVGYGIILSIISCFLLRKLTLSEGGKKLLLLLFWGGIATIFAGVLTGSYFGIDLNTLPPQIGNVLKILQIIDPIKNPLNVLILSLALGVVQNLFGVFLAMVWKIKHREYLTAVLDHGLWIYFLLCLVFLIVAGGTGSSLFGLFYRLSIVGAVLLALTQGRNEPTLLKKAVLGILSLYRTTGYLGDTLSYSRLLALMMTTSIIGMVVNIIAGLTKNSIPILGYVIMIAVLIFGHAFNLIVSVLGAFIHAARLQLVEFFGKFYEGGGREFKPFRRETRYIIIR